MCGNYSHLFHYSGYSRKINSKLKIYNKLNKKKTPPKRQSFYFRDSGKREPLHNRLFLAFVAVQVGADCFNEAFFRRNLGFSRNPRANGRAV